MQSRPKLIPELNVLDFRKSLDFYTKLASFKVVYDRPEELFAMLELDGARLMIEGITERSRTWMVGELVPPFGRGINLQIQVSNVEGLLHNFMEAEPAATNPRRGSGHPVARAL